MGDRQRISPQHSGDGWVYLILKGSGLSGNPWRARDDAQNEFCHDEPMPRIYDCVTASDLMDRVKMGTMASVSRDDWMTWCLDFGYPQAAAFVKREGDAMLQVRFALELAATCQYGPHLKYAARAALEALKAGGR